MMKQFNREDLEFHLSNKSFKGLSKEYILEKIFDDSIQKKWYPQEGDIIVGCTGNIFVISGSYKLHSSLGGEEFYFGGGTCSRDGGHILNETYCHTMNQSGIKYGWGKNGIEEKEDCYHSSWRDFKFVPYPHELNRM